MNKLYYGDNLDIIRKYIPNESVDLIYLDPPFNSQRAYNVIFQDKTGKDSSAQIQAFEDSWAWTSETQTAYDEIMTGNYPIELKDMIKAFHEFMGTSDLMAYLTMMAIRLVELKRVLKGSGSIYLHCDPTASHYLKILLDQIFGIENFRNEIIWQRTRVAKRQSEFWAKNYDTILFYTNGPKAIFNEQFTPHPESYKKSHYNLIEPETGRKYGLWDFTQQGAGEAKRFGNKQLPPPAGKHWIWSQERIDEAFKDGRIVFTKNGMPRLKRYLDSSKGEYIQAIWLDIFEINAMAKERLGYPTQKPIVLLERIIQASSNEGDIVLDPFCGCGTAVVAAEKLGRNWIGIDITHLAIALIKKRISDHFPDAKFTVIGEPRSVEDAKTLFEASAFQFESWAVSLLGGQPYKSKGGGDSGIDGLLYFKDYEGKFHRIIIEVKGGGYHPKEVRALKAVIDREEAPIGVLLALNPPTKGMISEAAALGKWKMPGSKREYPILQIITIEDIFSGKLPALPDTSETLKTAARTKRTRQQGKLL